MPKKAMKVVMDLSNTEPDWDSYAAMFGWLGWIGFYPVFFTVLAIDFFAYSVPIVRIILVATLFVMLISLVYPISSKAQPSWSNRIGSWLMRGAARYFSTKVIIEDPVSLEKESPVIFSLEPHDVMPVSIYSLSKFNGTVPTHDTVGCMSWILFKIPIIKHIYSWCSAIDAGRGTLQRALDKGQSPMICPGGIQEMTLMKGDKECVLYLKSRLGIIKLCLVNGVPLVPCFAFGQRKTFHFWQVTNPLLVRLGRLIGFLPMLYFGLWNLPLGPPKPTPLTMVIGKNLEMPKIDNPTKVPLRYLVSYPLSLSVSNVTWSSLHFAPKRLDDLRSALRSNLAIFHTPSHPTAKHSSVPPFVHIYTYTHTYIYVSNHC
jgi:2-acylglycerol O-acyltransferase 2